MKQDREFEPLIQRYVDGQATAPEIARLGEWLRGDTEARRWFIELMNLDSALASVWADCAKETEEVGVAQGSLDPNRDGDRRRHAVMRRPSTRWMLYVAACVTLLVGGTWWWQSTQRVFATVQRSAGVVELADGAALRGRTHKILAGTLELITARGARLVIEAPAEFRFDSADRLHLTQGRVAADVPPSAIGLTVVTPTGQAVDLGTKFGVDVPLQGEAEIHVFQGEVIAQSSGGGKRRSLRDGEAFLLQSGAGASRELRSAAFIRVEEMASLHAALAAGQRARSDAAQAELRREPTLIALLDFESDDLPEGTYRMVQGRWPGSHAPEIVSVGDRIKVDVGGDRVWPQITLAAWVRIDRLDAPYQSLLHTDGWSSSNPGQVHWMINRNTTMRLALFGNTLVPGSVEPDGFPDARMPVLPEQGRWVHLAAVYDSTKGSVRFYLNGAFDNETRQKIAHPARLGPSQIGNWDRGDRKLSGRIDDLLILGRAMSDIDVRNLYEAGRPYR